MPTGNKSAFLYRLGLAWFLCLLCILPAVSQEPTALPILPGDHLKLEVYGHKDLSTELEVSAFHTVTLPLLGQMNTQGKTIQQLETEITTLLDAEYLVDPKVTLERIAQEPFYILGQVKSPGTYPYRPGLDILKAVAIAGGFTSRANQKKFTIIRTPPGQAEQKITDSQNVAILPGDTIEVQLRWF